MPAPINKKFSSNNLLYEYGFNKKLCFFDPNLITTVGLLVTLLAAYFFYYDKPLCIIILLIILRSALDIYDGMIARKCNKTSKFGKYFDIISDSIFSLLFILLTYSKINKKYNIKYLLLVYILFSIYVSYNALFTEDYEIFHNNKLGILYHDNILIISPIYVYICFLIVKNYR